jgi:deferrochelatase/peroxidase EfeB
MGAGPVTDSRKKSPNWKLAPPHDSQTQGIVVSGFNALPSALALLLEFGAKQPTGTAGQERPGNWLRTLMDVAPITDADEADERAACIAFTWTGLQNLGLQESDLASFSAPFREGMYQEDRLRRLGDRINEVWQPTVINGEPLWSANIPARKNDTPQPKASPLGYVGGRREGDELEVRTKITVHALLLLYEVDEASVETWAKTVEQALAPANVKIVHRLLLDLHVDQDKNVTREHFGFADGLSQPLPYENLISGESAATVLIDGQPAPQDDHNGVPLGDILIGHNDLHHQRTPGPTVADCVKGRSAGLQPAGVAAGLLNFGLNGSYLVARELRQDVAAFWKSLEAEAAKLSQQNPSKPVSDQWLAERIIGRNIDGHLLCPGGELLPPDEFNNPQNDFLFKKTDPRGYGCPLGSHIRRANPRDGLAKDLASVQTMLDAANNHRILRRGRKYGPKIQQRDQDDNVERGLLFMCLNTDIARQFEFIQDRWLLDRNFATLFDQTDPLVGPKGAFTLNEQPLRRIVDVETYVQCAGGEYFFLPSIPALKYLAML